MKTLGHLVANIFITTLAAAFIAGTNAGAENTVPAPFDHPTGLTDVDCPQGVVVATAEKAVNLSFNAYDAVSGTGPEVSCELVVPANDK